MSDDSESKGIVRKVSRSVFLTGFLLSLQQGGWVPWALGGIVFLHLVYMLLFEK